MIINLYRLRRDINYIAFVDGVTIVNGVGWSASIQSRFGDPVLFDMLAEKSEEIGIIYMSPIDNRQYTEWKKPIPILGYVMTDGGSILRTDSLPPTEVSE